MRYAQNHYNVIISNTGESIEEKLNGSKRCQQTNRWADHATAQKQLDDKIHIPCIREASLLFAY